MKVQILIAQSGSHIVAHGVTVGTNGYYVEDPMLVIYSQDDSQSISARFIKFCSLSSDTLVHLKDSYVVAILQPTKEVELSYLNTINPKKEGDKPEGW